MKLILNNPYRALGLLVGTSAAQQNRQISRLKKYLEAEQEPDADQSFKVLGPLERNLALVEISSSQLNLDADRLSHALFWFYNGNSITDEPAFEALAEGDQLNAIHIWSKQVEKGLSDRTASAYFNLGTIKLNNAITGSSVSEGALAEGIELKLTFLESDFLNELIKKSTDETYKTSVEQVELTFLKSIVGELEGKSGWSSGDLLRIIEKIDFSAKDSFSKELVSKPISEIEKKVEETKIKRRSNRRNALIIGRELLASTQSQLNLVGSVFGKTNIKYEGLADKIADELLQCGIDYFKEFRDSGQDPSDEVLRFFRLAKSIAVGKLVAQRIKENYDDLQEWIDSKEEREKFAKVENDFVVLKNLIDEYDEKRSSVDNAEMLIRKSKTALYNLKNNLGVYDEVYLGLSSRIAGTAEGMCVEEINGVQKQLDRIHDMATKYVLLQNLKKKVDQAWGISVGISQMDLTTEFKNHHKANSSALFNLKKQLDQLNTISSSRTSSSSNSGGGCYIATMAYGDYDHPQVLKLRKFRDDKLSRSSFGRGFIKLYYHYSPKLVERLKRYDRVNSIVRRSLDVFIKLIER